MLKDLFAEIEKNHRYKLAVNPSAIDDFEKQCGYKLPEDLKEFYRRYKTVSLFDYEWGWMYRFVSINEIHMAGLDIFGEAYENDLNLSKKTTYSWFTICDVMDSNYIGIDLLSETDEQWNYIDCFHESYGIPGECMIVAKSFTELLEKCLRNKDTHYYFEEGFQSYGDALEITAETAIQRIDPVKSKWGKLGDFIQKIKHPQIQKGWRVHLIQSENSYREFFADKDYGSEEKSFEAAKRYLEENKK